MLKGALIGATFDANTVRQLNLDFIHLTAPWHQLALSGQYGGVPEIGLPIRYQLSDLRTIHTPAQFQNILAMPNRDATWTIGNEWNLPWANIPPQTPAEYVAKVAANMGIILPLVLNFRESQRFIFSLGSKEAFDGDPSQAELALRELKKYPNLAKLFCGAAINYYANPLKAREAMLWLQDVHAMMERVGVRHWTLTLKEVGGSPKYLQQEDAAHFITRLFQVLRKHAEAMPWLEAVEWFAINDLSAYEMSYTPLVDGANLTLAGEAWATG